MEIKNYKDLEKKLKEVVEKTMKNEVVEKAKEVMKDKINSEVYAKYTPYSTDGKTPHYIRTYELLNSIKTNMIKDNTLEIYNTRSEGSRYIPEIIESGKGYEWGYTRDLNKEIGERPFNKKTTKALKNGKFKKALKEGLKNQGLKVE